MCTFTCGIIVYLSKWRTDSWAVANEVPFSNCYPAGIYMFKVNNRNTRLRCKICSKLTIKA